MNAQRVSDSQGAWDSIAASLKQIAYWLRFFATQTDEFRNMKIGEKCVSLKSAGFSNKEIAETVGISEGSVRGHLSLARKESDRANTEKAEKV